MSERLQGVFSSLYLSGGSQTEYFEKEFAAFLGVDCCIAVASCTDAITLTLRGLGVTQGDQIITTPLTFAATAASILQAGAVPVFADVDARTGLLDPGAVAAKINSRTVGIIVVHLYGAMGDVREIARIAEREKLFLIEDAAHCIEGTRSGVRPGMLSDAACFSFFATKNMSAGEGGAVATRHRALAEWLRSARNHGMVKPEAKNGQAHAVWDIVQPSYNAKLTEFQAAMLRDQIPYIEQRLEIRDSIAQRYDEAIDGHAQLDRPSIPESVISARHLYVVLAPEGAREAVVQYLVSRHIGIGIHYRCLANLSFIRDAGLLQRGMCPEADRMGDRVFSVPLYPRLLPAEVDWVAESLRQVKI